VIAGIILAAGASTRMGRPKALLDYLGETFVARLVRVFSRLCDPVLVVLGHHAETIQAHLEADFVINPDPERGQLSSLQTGIAALPADVEGFLFTPVDSPTVEEWTVSRLVEEFRPDGIVIPRYNGRRGHPVCVPRRFIPTFLSLAPTEQTRTAIQHHADRIHYVDVDDAGILADIDDPASYHALKGVR
jgi:CTP:molybdopterin cytidylyltransferase MocA